MMFRWTPYVFIRLTAALLLGILAYTWQWFPTMALLHIEWLGGMALGYGVLWTATRKLSVRYKTWAQYGNTLLGLWGIAFLVWAGGFLAYQKTETNRPNHLVHLPDSVLYYKGVIVSDVQQTAKTNRAVVSISAVKTRKGWQDVCGKISLSVQKDSANKQLRYGTHLLVAGRPDTVAGSRNPQEFSFKQYLAYQQQVYHQQYIKSENYKILKQEPTNWLVAWSYQLSRACDAVFRKFISSDREYGISSALILGIKDGLDNDIKNAYSAAGAMHVLAVSGMHVALVYELFVILLGFLKKRKGYGGWTFAVIVLFLLWFYALITGWSASVLRAVTMFSFIVVADAFERKTNIYNTLAVSAFVLLCYNPFFVFDVGFLLSYIAVAGIVYIHPLLYQKLTVENKVLDYVWNISCVSVAAQIATFPLSLYYFHQFPNYFLLSNLFIIPISTVAMYAGLAMLAVSWIPYISLAAAWLLYWSVWLLNASVLVTEQLPMAITQGIQISALETLLIYLAIFLTFVFFYVKRMGYAVSVVVCCITIACIQIMEVWERQQQRRIAIYYVPKQSVMCFTNAQQQHLVCADSLLHDETKKRFHLYADWYKQGINEVNFVSVPSPAKQKSAVVSKEFSHGAVLLWQGKKMLLLNKKLGYGEKISIPANIDYLVLQNDAVFSLKVFEKLPPSVQLIIDTSNKQYRSKKLHAEAKTLGLKCHNVWEAGAYVEGF